MYDFMMLCVTRLIGLHKNSQVSTQINIFHAREGPRWLDLIIYNKTQQKPPFWNRNRRCTSPTTPRKRKNSALRQNETITLCSSGSLTSNNSYHHHPPPSLSSSSSNSPPLHHVSLKSQTHALH